MSRLRIERHGNAGKVHVRNTAEQMKLVGPRSLGVSLLTAGFVGMVFTIQVWLFGTPVAHW
jgi:ABC-type transporter Mla maintaining outer membrane lipid asymmetry permease subunit MlaE